MTDLRPSCLRLIFWQLGPPGNILKNIPYCFTPLVSIFINLINHLMKLNKFFLFMLFVVIVIAIKAIKLKTICSIFIIN